MTETVRDRMLAIATPAPSLEGGPLPVTRPAVPAPERPTAPPEDSTAAKLLATYPAGPSLEPQSPPADTSAELVRVRVDSLQPDPGNPRERLTEIRDLAGSMKQVGLVQPIVARRSGANLIIVAGHRRHAAARLLGWDTVPVLIRAELRPDDVLASMLAENGQRKDLDPIEEARAIRRLIQEQKLATHALAAERIGRHASFVSGRLALLDLSDREQELVRAREMTVTEAVARGRQQAGKTAATRDSSVPHFGAMHALASKARAHCKTQHQTQARLPGGVACGPCWEHVIRVDAARNR